MKRKKSDKSYQWTKDKRDLLLALIQDNANSAKLEIELKCSFPIILKELREMGFEGLRDARRVMRG